jgi:Undecaprenyl-phosphate glucose phosphotransferase
MSIRQHTSILKKDKSIFLFTDFWSVIFAVFTCRWIFTKWGYTLDDYSLVLFTVTILVSWTLVTKLYIFSKRTGNRRKATIIEAVKEFSSKWIRAVFMVGFSLYLLHLEFSKWFFIISMPLFLSYGLLNRIAAKQFLQSIRRKGFNYRRISIVSTEDFVINLEKESLKHPEYGFKINHKHILTYDNGYDYDLGEICNSLSQFDIDYVYVNIDLFSKVDLNYFLRFAEINGIKVHFIQKGLRSLYDETFKVEIDYFGETPTLSLVERSIEQLLAQTFKRVVDILIAGLFLILIASWLFPLIAIISRLDSKGPTFFKQKRTGLNGHEFNCLKFRTMKVNENADKLQAEKGDSRITSFGALLRSTSLDELPQFINVLLGQMSLVGPRPHMCKHTEEYSELIRPFAYRHWVKPGITGLAQIKGFRGETKNIRRMEHRVRMDLFYIQNWSGWLDTKIFFQSAWTFFTFQNKGD